MDTFVLYADYLGVFVFALSGALSAVREKYDIFGIVSLAGITAIAGGTFRDIMINEPIFWFSNGTYLFLIFIAAIFVFKAPVFFNKFPEPLLVFDALGLGIFFGIAAQKVSASTLFSSGLVQPMIQPVITTFFGVLTAVGGGICRDLCSNRKPVIFFRQVYASTCVAGGIVFHCGLFFNIQKEVIFLVTILFIFTLRLLAIKHNWHLPTAKSN